MIEHVGDRWRSPLRYGDARPRRSAPRPWSLKIGDERPAHTTVVTDSGIHPGGTAADAGCGTGRAIPALSAAVEPTGQVLGST